MASEQRTHPFLRRFLERWTAEFRRAAESQTNPKPEITRASAEELAQWDQNASDLLWWKQEAGGKDGFAIWIAAEEACWTALGNAAEQGGDPKQAYLNLVKQANLNLAGAAEAGFSKPFHWRDGSTEEAPPACETLALIKVQIILGGKALPPLLAGVERKALALEPGSTGSEIATVPAPGVSPMLSRLMDLQLPVTVLLGRAVLPIRDVLKISSGSLIELDRQINDYVEVMVHGTVVARGEIVSVRGNYGVRIKEIISRQDRIALQDAA